MTKFYYYTKKYSLLIILTLSEYDNYFTKTIIIISLFKIIVVSLHCIFKVIRKEMKQTDTTMASSILKLLTSRPNVILSWGLSEPRAIENGLRFRVEGFRHQGLCEIIYVEGTDTFTFRTIDKDGLTIQELDDLYLDNLIDTIDRTIETGDDPKEYKKAVSEWLDTFKY